MTYKHHTNYGAAGQQSPAFSQGQTMADLLGPAATTEHKLDAIERLAKWAKENPAMATMVGNHDVPIDPPEQLHEAWQAGGRVPLAPVPPTAPAAPTLPAVTLPTTNAVVPPATPPAASKTSPNVYAPKSSTVVGQIHVMSAEGTLHSKWNVLEAMLDWFNLLMCHYPLVIDEANPASVIVAVPVTAMAWETAAPVAFNACTFDAATDYMAARWGRRLHSTDKDWLARHPWSADSGVPMAATPMALHQLCEPYGYGVSRVRVRTGTTMTGEQLSAWMYALGVNPMAVLDSKTTNAEWAAANGMDAAAADAMFRFEFHDEPLAESVIGERGWSSTTGLNVGAQGGHARYLAPRGTAGDWAISVQLAPRDGLFYLIDPTAPAYVPREGNKLPRLGGVVRPDGAPVGVMVQGSYYAPENIPTAPAAPAAPATQTITTAGGTIITPLGPTGRSLDKYIEEKYTDDVTPGRLFCKMCEEDFRDYGHVLQHCFSCNMLTKKAADAITFGEPIESTDVPAGRPLDAFAHRPYSVGTCAGCQGMLAKPGKVEQLMDQLDELDLEGTVMDIPVERYPHTEFCVECAAELLTSQRCYTCKNLLVQVVDDPHSGISRLALPTIVDIQWGDGVAARGTVVHYACPTCRTVEEVPDKCGYGAYEEISERHFESFATPEQFALHVAGRDLEDEYLASHGGVHPDQLHWISDDTMPVEDDEDDDMDDVQAGARAAEINAVMLADLLPTTPSLEPPVTEDDFALIREYGNEGVVH